LLHSSKFKSFSYLYNEEQFIAALANDVVVVKSLPDDLKEDRKKNKFPILSLRRSSSLSFYIREILPKLKKAKVVGFVIADGGCLEVWSDFLPTLLLKLGMSMLSHEPDIYFIWHLLEITTRSFHCYRAIPQNQEHYQNRTMELI